MVAPSSPSNETIAANLIPVRVCRHVAACTCTGVSVRNRLISRHGRPGREEGGDAVDHTRHRRLLRVRTVTTPVVYIMCWRIHVLEVQVQAQGSMYSYKPLCAVDGYIRLCTVYTPTYSTATYTCSW